MFEDVLDVVDKFAKDYNLVFLGIAILIGVFIACFFLQTFWRQWDDRAKEDEIYGKPRNRNR